MVFLHGIFFFSPCIEKYGSLQVLFKQKMPFCDCTMEHLLRKYTYILY